MIAAHKNPVSYTHLDVYKRQLLDYAAVRKYRRGENPARWKGHLEQLLPAPGKIAKVEHHRALPVDAMGAFMAQLRKQPGTAAKALELAILCASRSGEVRLATWGEFDLDAKIWTIPAERMKAKVQHRVPPVSYTHLDVYKRQREASTTPPHTARGSSHQARKRIT